MKGHSQGLHSRESGTTTGALGLCVNTCRVQQQSQQGISEDCVSDWTAKKPCDPKVLTPATGPHALQNCQKAQPHPPPPRLQLAQQGSLKEAPSSTLLGSALGEEIMETRAS